MTKSNKTDEIANPYRPYDLKSGDWFYHEDVIRKIKEIFETSSENRVIVLQGDPGSGKSSTLKRIAKFRDIIGKEYIPIYLDSRNYINLDPGELLISVYNDVIEKINKFGYQIPKFNKIKKEEITDYAIDTIQSLLLIVEPYLKDKVLFLILDEFDKLLEKIDENFISEYIRYFKHIEKNWSNYGLILIGDGRLVNLTKDKTIVKFLQSASKINIEDILDKKTIKKIIVEPAKGQLSYDRDAIEKIIWYSGKNLYFQQLICYYLVNDLYEKKQKECTAEDVEDAVQQILNETIPEFALTWEERLSSIEAKLIVSAFADENAMEKSGSSYRFKGKKLLDGILGTRKYNEIEKLHQLGYINKMDGEFFSESPLKVPLYGKWVKKEHPFIKTIIENIESIADRTELDLLIEEIQKTPGNSLMPFNKTAILDISREWFLLSYLIVKEQSPEVKEQAENFFTQLSKMLNLSIKEETEPDKSCFIFDIKNLNIGILDEAFCFIQDKPEITREDVFNLENMATALAQDTLTQLTIYFYFWKSAMVEELVKKVYLNLIAIRENDLMKLILSTRPRETFRKTILSNLSLQKISPYKTAGPAKAIFYGRSDIIDQITRSTDTSYAIVGSRKIGKSSLLYKLKDNPPTNAFYIFLNLELVFSGTPGYQVFLKSLESSIEKAFNQKIRLGNILFRRNLNRLPEIIQQLNQKQKGKKIIFIFDEVDPLIQIEKKHNFKMMRVFRTMSQNNWCQFIFAGFKDLFKSKRDSNNPMYNFWEEITLEPLEREAALDLITKPMESMGIHYKNKEDRELILKHTACHPNLLQFFCKHLLTRIDRHDNVEDRRTVFREDIKNLVNNRYEKCILDEVYMFSYDLSAVERLILILLAEAQEEYPGKESFSTGEIKDILLREGIEISRDDLDRNLSNLVMRFILREENEGNENYCFALSIFEQILRKRIDVTYKRNLIEEIKK